MTFDEIIRPLTVREFADTYFGVRYLLAKPGTPRFRALVQWDEINAALRHVRFSPQRLRVVQNAKTLPASAYTFVDDDASGGSSLDARRLEQFLAKGATLSINKVDELFPEVQALAESCEELFRIPVGANLYAGWRTDNGFDLHWDRHDTLILQISGRKRWTVYEPTVEHPMDDRLLTEPPKPTGAPVWEGLLEEGDLLYMPRGWWHVAYPLDEPTLHVTIGLRHRTGATLLRWVAAELNKHVEFRRDLPLLDSPQAQATYATTLRDLLTAAVTDDIVERYMRVVEDAVPARPRVFLPDAAMPTPVRLTPDTPLRLIAGGRLYLDPPKEGRTVTFKIGESDWSCDIGLVPALRLLRQARPTTLRDMTATVEPNYRLPLRIFVDTLLARHAMWSEPAAAETRGDRIAKPQEAATASATS
jgi:ribosomal protein L16 Arg81 hydroxylase